MIRVLATGPLTTTQDLGRWGWGHLGVPRSGPADAPSHHLANRLVGNAVDAATMEVLRGGLTVEFLEPALFAIAGAPVGVRLDGVPVAFGASVWAQAGAVLSLAVPRFGLWSYFAVRGGLDVEPQLGSRSVDTLSGIGPPPLAPGRVVPIGGLVAGPPGAADALIGLCDRRDIELRVSPGPRHEWFTRQAQELLVTTAWTLSTDTNRIAARLTGPELALVEPRQLPTEGLQIGSVQVPASGQPIVHLANHPPTGGYPVIAVVDESDLPMLAQSLPGTVVRFARRAPGRA
ncbi:biotin-dependent carboxyltransferase family protein [Micromonospora sp. CB01531]|uniref:5-oxoprolinase subunit C family protein n=1 Tax=Micromonospora sp. CB01531 TaxID=1718947 RepID=UPI00093A0ACE|nr:biotin-dependent carboxyltransferase family protein [Micromonospora sp. CB01531]OKI43568.1 hypothetical protein A6A27_38925 [Micromonospora sp. CB01531]